MNDNTRQRLVNFSENPPASAWPRIAETLDTPAFAQKLHAFETAPPVAAWEKIHLHLPQPTAKVIKLRSKLFQISIAAAAVFAIAVASIFFFYNKGTANLATTNQSNIPATKNALLENPSPSNTEVAQQTDPKEMATAANFALVHFSPRVHIPKKRLVATAVPATPQQKPILDIRLPDRYMIATTSTGKVVRLPKKAYDDYACAESYQNYWCKEKIAAIQNKLAASVATDFTDFIDLLNKLQDNQ